MKNLEKHNSVLNKLLAKYKSDENVIGIYLFGSLSKNIATEKSDIDLEIIFKKRRKDYELLHKKIDGIKVDLSLYDKKKFLHDFIKRPYNQYAALNNKILYDPDGILKRYLRDIKQYFKKNPEILKYWKTKEIEWKKAKKEGRKGTAENYFDIMKKLEKR